MGKADVIRKKFWKNRERYADFINYVIYDGKSVLCATDLEEADASEIFMETASEKYMEQDNWKLLEKKRDIIRKVTDKAEYCLIGIENQEMVHYAMPVRTMLYDALRYQVQLDEIKLLHKKRKDLRDAEFLSGFSRNDRLRPVSTITIYYGEESWDGPRDLEDILDLEGISRELRGYIATYPLYLVEIQQLQHLEKFQTDLRFVFGMIQCRDSKRQLKEYLKQNAEHLRKIDQIAGEFIAVTIKLPGLFHYLVRQENEEGTDMCRAMYEWIADEREEGRIEGQMEGKIEGKIEGIILLGRRYGLSREAVLEVVMEEMQIDGNQAQGYVKRYWNQASGESTGS